MSVDLPNSVLGTEKKLSAPPPQHNINGSFGINIPIKKGEEVSFGCLALGFSLGRVFFLLFFLGAAEIQMTSLVGTEQRPQSASCSSKFKGMGLGMVSHACNPSYSEAETGGSWFEASLGKNQQGLISKTSQV
jgi:hypothetical protein